MTSFDQYTKEDLNVYYCPECGRSFAEATTNRMDDTSLPCPCGVQVDDLSKVVPFLDGETDEGELTTWDELVAAVVDSGMWRCKMCGYTAPEKRWEGVGYGDEVFTVCPRCKSVEDYEVLTVEKQ